MVIHWSASADQGVFGIGEDDPEEVSRPSNTWLLVLAAIAFILVVALAYWWFAVMSDKTPFPAAETFSGARPINEPIITPEQIDQSCGGNVLPELDRVLAQAQVLSDGCITVAYSYIGPEATQALYRKGTIGKAKEHLEATAHSLNSFMKSFSGKAFVSVNKGLVTRASAVIPVIPLYLASLFKVMKKKGLHEGCIEQINRLFSERLYRADGTIPVDSENRIRIDDWELSDEVQKAVDALKIGRAHV